MTKNQQNSNKLYKLPIATQNNLDAILTLACMGTHRHKGCSAPPLY